MSQQKDFVLFDDPSTPVPSSSQSFGPHRSPAQSPYIDAVQADLPATLDQNGSPQRKRQRSEFVASPLAAQLSLADPQSGSLGSPMHDLNLRDPIPSAKSIASPTSGSSMTTDQQERVKAQIRADLADVDTRAFTGPLRDILQKQDYTPKANNHHTSPLASGSDPMQAGVAPSFTLFPDYDVGEQGRSGQSATPQGGQKQQASETVIGQDDDMAFLSQRSSDSIRTRSSNFDSAFGSIPRSSQNVLPDWAMQSQANQTSREFRQQSQRPMMPPPSQNLSQGQLAYSAGPVSMEDQSGQQADLAQGRKKLTRESSGLTVSPKQAFKDYDDVENVLNHSGLGNMPSLFAPVPPGLSDTTHSSQLTSRPHNDVTMNSRSKSDTTTQDTPISGPSTAMSRNDTIKQQHYQKRPGPTVYQGGDSRASASQDSGSQSSLFSPADSGETISTDDDEDERPYNPSGVRPSMLRGGPSSLYLNFPAKGAPPSSPNAQKSLPAKDGAPANGAWGHVKTEPWSMRQPQLNHPRFSDVSASSSDSEDDRGQSKYAESLQANRLHRPPLPHHKSSSEDVDDTLDPSQRYPHYATHLSRANMPGALGGYGYIPGSAESGLSVVPPTTGKHVMKRDDTSFTGSQDESQSPSIRSSAQIIDRKQPTAPPVASHAQKAKPSVAPSVADESSAVQTDDKMEASDDEEESEDVDVGSDEESEYDGNDGEDGSSTKKRPRKVDGDDTSTQRSTNRKPTTNTHKTQANTFGTTKCDYTSPVTGVTCQTAFHRPYDLARHRETIHAREEAGFIREGKLKLDNCVVLGKEVDPKKSMAVVEWKCKTCAASFSRKDAMLRHERLRHNAPK